MVALDEPAEGDFIQVRPAGSKDVLSFSVGEVTTVKPPRKRKQPEPAAKKSTSPTAAKQDTTAAPVNEPAASTDRPQKAKRAESKTSTSTGKSAGTAARESKTGDAKPADAKPATGAGASSSTPAANSRRKPRQPSGATVTLTADESGQWNVEVTTGKKRMLRPTPVAASAVAQAAKTLHDDVAEAVEPLLQAAREQQRKRVEALQNELAEAQRKLDDLAD
ncbi:hypothetical protein GCM10027563_04740 [Parasphingorhabdus pacifica]